MYIRIIYPEVVDVFDTPTNQHKNSTRNNELFSRKRAETRTIVLDRMADSVFASEDTGKDQEDRKLAVAQIIECRNVDAVREWLETATQETLTALVEQMISTADGTNEQAVLDWAKSQKRRFSVIQ